MPQRRRAPARRAVRTSPGKRKQPAGFGLYKLVHRVLHPGVTRLTARSYRSQPLRAWETALGLGRKRKGVVHKVRARKSRYGGASGLF